MDRTSLDTLCAALAYALRIEPPKEAAEKNKQLCEYVDEIFGGKGADRIIMYNPDAIGQWIYEKYPFFLRANDNFTGVKIPFETVMPSVTPVCFGTMYTGAQPEVHGIMQYEKPVIKIDTLFDALIRAGKKPAIIATPNCSLGNIYLERDMDYFLCDDIEKINAKAVELILRDEHDFILIYNGNYDAVMHKHGPESPNALAELRQNSHFFGVLCNLVKNNLKNHNTLLGFAMDHGCHEVEGGGGAHGTDKECDLHILHVYQGFAREE